MERVSVGSTWECGRGMRWLNGAYKAESKGSTAAILSMYVSSARANEQEEVAIESSMMDSTDVEALDSRMHGGCWL